MNRELLEQALDALKDCLGNGDCADFAKVMSCMNALRAELAKPEPEPVAFLDKRDGCLLSAEYGYADAPNWKPLYTKDQL